MLQREGGNANAKSITFVRPLLLRGGRPQGSHESVIVRKLLVNSFVSQLTIANELVLRHRRCTSGRVDVLTEPLH